MHGTVRLQCKPCGPPSCHDRSKECISRAQWPVLAPVPSRQTSLSLSRSLCPRSTKVAGTYARRHDQPISSCSHPQPRDGGSGGSRRRPSACRHQRPGPMPCLGLSWLQLAAEGAPSKGQNIAESSADLERLNGGSNLVSGCTAWGESPSQGVQMGGRNKGVKSMRKKIVWRSICWEISC